MYCANKKAADAAESAANTANNALALANRPWIKIKHRIVQPLTFNVARQQNVAMMIVEDMLDNVGNSVALNVLSWEDIIPLDPDMQANSALVRRDQWCNANATFDTRTTAITGSVLFPNDPLQQNSTIGPTMNAVDKAIKANALTFPKLFPGQAGNTMLGKVGFVMVGCVVYRSSFEKNGTRPHKTEFLYHLGIPEPQGGMQPFIIPQGVANNLQMINFEEGLSAN